MTIAYQVTHVPPGDAVFMADTRCCQGVDKQS